MLAFLGHIITFVIAWLIVIAGALGVLMAIGFILVDLISLFLSPFSKKADDFTDGISNRTVLGFGGRQTLISSFPPFLNPSFFAT